MHRGEQKKKGLSPKASSQPMRERYRVNSKRCELYLTRGEISLVVHGDAVG